MVMKRHVAILVRDKDNRILFVRRSMKKKTLPGAWSFPSGTVEDGEDIFMTAIREAKEELGIRVSVEKLMATKKLPEFSVCLYFILCVTRDGIPFIQEPNEIDELSWMTMSNFFKKFSDDEIGHGLIWLRQNPNIWDMIV